MYYYFVMKYTEQPTYFMTIRQKTRGKGINQYIRQSVIKRQIAFKV